MNDPLKKYRRQFRIWKNDRKLKREQQVYAAEFQRKGLAIPDDDALHRDLKMFSRISYPNPGGS